jgi:hypothetical protein
MPAAYATTIAGSMTDHPQSDTRTRVGDAVAQIRLKLLQNEARQVHVLGHLNRILLLPLEDQVVGGPSVCGHGQQEKKIVRVGRLFDASIGPLADR